MLSVVIATHDSERALLATLAALVAGAAAGVVREVIVADAGSCDATAAVADGAGCRVLISSETRGARLKAAAATARAPWLLFFAPGAVPDATWIDETRRFIEQTELTGWAASHAAVFRRGSAAFRPALVEALALLRTALGARPNASQGLLIARTLYDALGGHRDVAEPERDLARRLGRRRVVLLRCEATAAFNLDS
ncbi:MAG TPA: glycosyltransferase [Xanthobacteraceae bacterium]|jgi:glycosyltransferase involved in cell wall biosynthesis